MSPMAAKLWLPYGSIWLPPMMTWRRPDQTTSNIDRYGFHASTTPSAVVNIASPSVITRSGSNDSRASSPPIRGIVPIGLATISPSPRKHSATAMTQTSARVTAVAVVMPGSPRNREAQQSDFVGCSSGCHLPLIVVLADVDPCRAPLGPRLVGLRRRGVLALERLVALVVRYTRGEVRAVGRLDDAVGPQPTDPLRVVRTFLGEI